MPPVLSIVVPTRNRDSYATCLISTILQSPSSDFELIVQDNTNSRIGSNPLSAFSDPRYLYAHDDQRLSVVENFDRALMRAKGHYVCMLGDDDGILVDEAVELARRMLESNIDAALPIAIHYAWPGVKNNTWGEIGGHVLRETIPQTRAFHQDLDLEFKKVFQDAGSLGLRQLPRVYQGIVLNERLKQMRTDLQTCFPGPSPDMANAVALTRYVRTPIVVNLPLLIAGNCASSAGGQGSEKKHVGKLEEQSHLPRDIISRWRPQIPRIWSGPTIYAQSMADALSAIDPHRASLISWAGLYATFLVFEFGNRQHLLDLAKLSPRLLITELPQALFIASRLLAIRSARFLRNRSFYKNWSTNCLPARDIRQAVDVVRRVYATEFQDLSIP